jgi:C_GCAxxG_C_C family probable redox protein
LPAEELSKKALANFKCGYNCAQSVLLTLLEDIEAGSSKNVLVPKIAAGFGSGFGGCGSVCGALVGGVMAVGVKYGSDDADPKKRAKVYEATRALYKGFEAQHGSAMCSTLKANKKPCTALVEWVIQSYVAMEKP